jgi:inosine-uridine nucleoside N-ribohydrolase
MIKALRATMLVLLVAVGLRAQEAPPPIPMIYDTDIGTDVDDAFALALVLRSPEFELLGVTTASGDTRARARLAAKMLAAAGRPDVPVAAGEPGKPLPIEQCRWADGFVSPAIRSESAVEFLKSEIERWPGQITLVPVGPLTNIGALLERHPEVGKKIKRIVLMGGSIALGYGPGSPPVAEYNIAQDPLAAQIVFSSGVPILMVPLDVTSMLRLEAEGRHQVFTRLNPLTDALALLYHLWNRPAPVLFDPMAVAMLIDPTLCETRELAVEVDAKGMTRPLEGKKPNATVALKTDPKRFFEFYLSRVGR